jgi:hypothetical protein
VNEITITPGWSTPAGRVTLTAKLDETIVDVRQVNLAKPKERAEYIEELAAKIPDLDRDELDQQLLAIAAAAAAQSVETSAEERASQATLIIELVKESNAELFHDEEHTAFATITIDDHRETHRVHSRNFRKWLGLLHYRQTQTAANAQAVTDAITTLEGMALYDGPEFTTYIRIAPFESSIVIDVGDTGWNSIVVTADGWRVCGSNETPVRFRRAAGMRPLVLSVRGGSLSELRPFVNIGNDEQWALYLSWMVAAYRPKGPYPVLAVHGQHGSAKSSLCRFTRALIDPSTTPLRRPPREERDLMIAAANSWVVSFDNLSGISPSLSDSVCVLSTGGGFATRELFSDADERLFSATRPTMVNGIDDLATRSDLLDRCINLKLPVIADDQRRDETEMEAAFERVAPRILGALLDAASMAIRNHASVKLVRKPRMADFAMWAVAAEPALGIPQGSFLNTYLKNRDEASVLAVESSIIGPVIQAVMANRESWEGTAKELLNLINDAKYSDEQTRKRKEWPKGARAVRSALDRLAPNLRAIGIEVGLPKDRTGHANKRLISIRQGPAQQVAQVASVANPPYDPNTDGWPPDKCDPLTAGAASRPVAAAVDRSQFAPLGDSKTQIATCATDATGRPGAPSEFHEDYAAAMEVLGKEELQ